MTRSMIMTARHDADVRLYTLTARRRVSIEELALAHVASGRPDVLSAYRERARLVVPAELAADVIVGPTFADTLDLNRARYDLYEAGGLSVGAKSERGII